MHVNCPAVDLLVPVKHIQQPPPPASRNVGKSIHLLEETAGLVFLMYHVCQTPTQNARISGCNAL